MVLWNLTLDLDHSCFVMDELQKARFSGFAEQYNANRPAGPVEIIKTVVGLYSETDIRTVIDVGCGTGLSTFPWAKHAATVIGVEPNAEMISVARATARGEASEKVSFIEAEGHELPIEDNAADLITCSQSFHWMPPQKTLAEFGRILKPGGVVAIYDCDWPPVAGIKLETTFNSILQLAHRLLEATGGNAQQWPKSEHLKNLKSCGLFRFVREMSFHREMKSDASHFIGLIESQGAFQQMVKSGDKAFLQTYADAQQEIRTSSGEDTFPLVFSYQMRLAVK